MIYLNAHMKHFQVLILLVYGVAGCAGAPTQELADARSAMIAAEEAHGKETVADNLTAAKKIINNAEVQLELGNYPDARKLAVQARNEATKARNIAIAIEEARQAINRATQVQALNPALQQAFDDMVHAAKKSDEHAVMTLSSKTIELAAQNENRVYLDKAKLKLNQCGQPGSLMNKHPQLWREAQMAISRDQGSLALQHASALCNL